MATGVEKKRITAEELEKLPTGMGVRYELIEGELIEMSPASLKHGIIASRIMRHLSNFVAEHELGEVTTAETGFEIKQDPYTVRAPDMAFIPKDRISSNADEIPGGYSKIVPALVVEVISPGDTSAEIEDKTQMWFGFGVSEVWNVYLKGKRILAHHQDGQVRLFQGEEAIKDSPILSGFELKLTDIFK